MENAPDFAHTSFDLDSNKWLNLPFEDYTGAREQPVIYHFDPNPEKRPFKLPFEQFLDHDAGNAFGISIKASDTSELQWKLDEMVSQADRFLKLKAVYLSTHYDYMMEHGPVDITEFLNRFPGVEHLYILAFSQFKPIRHICLRSLALCNETGWGDRINETLLDCVLPGLEHFTLTKPNEGAAKIFASNPFPGLRSLAVQYLPRALGETLFRSALFQQLEVLHLTERHINDDSVQAILDIDFPNLRKIDFSKTFVSSDLIDEIRKKTRHRDDLEIIDSQRRSPVDIREL